MGGLFLYLVPPAGKETIAPLLVGLHYPLYLVFISIVLMDAVVSFIIAFNFDLLERVPYLNKLIYKIETSAKALLEKRPFIMKSSYLAMFILMCTPFQGCGATTLTIVGKLLGMSYKVVFNILLFGSILSTLSYIYLFEIVMSIWDHCHDLSITILFCLILFTAIGFVTYIVNEKFHLRQVKPIYTILTGIFVILSVLMGILLLYMYFRAN
ncbi:MAG TPA: small multi-drug export protein [Methanocorpusculum sp.]|nr:small multi-drug export protein [Methanocorpusculum sp.]